MKKVAVLLLEQIPQVHHLAPIAFEMSQFEDIEVSVIGNPDSMDVFEKLSSLYPEHRCYTFTERSKGFRRISEWLRGRKIPRTKSILDRNFAKLMGFDMIISSDFYTHWMIQHKQESKPKFVFGFHGAGDHAYGFKDELKDYDYLLLSGPKIQQRLKDKGILEKADGILSGYVKFDIIKGREKPVFFDNELPIVLYSPHFNQQLSSYHDWGIEVLEYFYNSKDYNLIFAPHFNLFNKQNDGHVIPSIPSKYLDVSNIYVDKGSYKSIDMTYTLAADLFLGDVSSQIYEFLYRPRPCLFLNSKAVDWKRNNNYQHWHYGPVINKLEALDSSIKMAFDTFDGFKEVQMKGFNDTFSKTEVSAGQRAASALYDVLTKEMKV